MIKPGMTWLICAGIISGCSSQPAHDSDNRAAKAEPDVQCHTVAITGSMVERKICTTQADRDAQKRATDASLSDIQQGPHCTDAKNCGPQ